MFVGRLVVSQLPVPAFPCWHAFQTVTFCDAKLKQTLSSISCLWSSCFCHGHRKLTNKASDAIQWTRAVRCPLVPYLEGMWETWGQWMRKVIKFCKCSLKVFLSRDLLDSINWRNTDYKDSAHEVSNKNSRNRTWGPKLLFWQRIWLCSTLDRRTCLRIN